MHYPHPLYTLSSFLMPLLIYIGLLTVALVYICRHGRSKASISLSQPASTPSYKLPCPTFLSFSPMNSLSLIATTVELANLLMLTHLWPLMSWYVNASREEISVQIRAFCGTEPKSKVWLSNSGIQAPHAQFGRSLTHTLSYTES